MRMKSLLKASILSLGALSLSVSAAVQAKDKKDKNDKGDDAPIAAVKEDPFPSTYRPYSSTATAIKNVTIFDGKGGQINNGVIFMAGGQIRAVGDANTPIPADILVFDGQGKFVTPGIIDVHSHVGNYPVPSVDAHSDGNEVTAPVTAGVWAEHGVWPQDPAFTRALTHGGVTSLQILPGSANLFGGRSVVLKNVGARTMQQMKFPGAPQGLKMACGENPKRVYGNKGRMPGSRMGNISLDRETWAEARAYKEKWDKYEKSGGSLPSRDMDMDTLKAALEGKIAIHNHCYRADEMAIVVDMAKEFGYRVSAFHHAVEAYKIADILAENKICSAIWADWWGFKMESYDGIPENAALLQQAGACVIIHSDSRDQIQRLNQEAAKALAAGRRMGMDISDATAIQWLTGNAAMAIGVDDKTGTLEKGKMADVVLWNGHPLSVYSRPEKIWIDGAMLYDAQNPDLKPVADFEFGQPGEGDVK